MRKVQPDTTTKGMPRALEAVDDRLAGAIAQQKVDDRRIHLVRCEIDARQSAIGRREACCGGSDVLELKVIVHGDDGIVLDDENPLAS